MPAKDRPTYQSPGGLEQAIVDLVRVGATGYAPGVRQLAARLTHVVPGGVSDASTFREALNAAIAAAAKSAVGLRFDAGEIPTTDDGGLELADVNPHPYPLKPTLDQRVEQEIEHLLRERAAAEEFARAGVALTRTVLMSGPPGVGKTMSAQWIAGSLGLPLVTLSLPAITSSYLGTSGKNMRRVFDYAKSGPCVLLLDEFDAIAKRRDDTSDIGELKRLVNVLLMEMDRWPETSLLIAATNHPQLLDPAVGRRFDLTINIAPPGDTQREKLWSDLLASAVVDNPGPAATHGTSFARATRTTRARRPTGSLVEQGSTQSLSSENLKPLVGLLASATSGATGSDITRMWQTCLRKSILNESRTTDELLLTALGREMPSGPERDRAWALASRTMHLSNREIAEIVGVSHPTVASAIKRAAAAADDLT